MSGQRYRHPLSPVREQGFYLEFPSAPPQEVRTALGNLSWRYGGGRWWYRGRTPEDDAVEELERALRRLGTNIEEHGGEFGWVP